MLEHSVGFLINIILMLEWLPPQRLSNGSVIARINTVLDQMSSSDIMVSKGEDGAILEKQFSHFFSLFTG